MLPNLIEDCKKININSHLIQGHSISAERTGFYSYKFGTHLDAGLASCMKTRRVCISHTHADHMQQLPALLRGNGDTVVEIICPKESRDDLEKFIQAFDKVSHNKSSSNRYKVSGVVEGDVVYTGRTSYIKVVECFHLDVPCRGYIFFEIKNKLKPELVGITQELILKLKKEKFKVSEEVHVPIFAYICDTSIKVLTNELLRTQILMIECTFWNPDMEFRAIETGHISWKQLEPYVVAYPNTHFILFHKSKRYLKTDLKVNHTNVTIW